MSAEPMPDEELAEIEARAEGVYPASGWDDYEVAGRARRIVTKDVPALVAEVRRLRGALDAARALVAKIPHEEGCPGNRHKDCGPEGESWCCDRSRSREECLRRKADCDCHAATWRELLGVPA